MFRLLLVDDEQVILNGLYGNVDWFELGIDGVYKAENAEAALQILENNRIDVVITDICMPEAGGLEMSERIRKKWPMVKIILLSGYREFLYAKKGMELGVYGYVTKPVSYKEIAQIVAGAVEQMEEELNQKALLKEAEQKLAMASDVLRERFLNRWITRGILPDGDSEMLERTGLPKDLTEEAVLVLFRNDSVERGTRDYGFVEYMLPSITACITAEKMHMQSFVDLDDNLVVLIRCGSREELCSAYANFNNIFDVVQLSLQKTFGEALSIFWEKPVPLRELPRSYKAIRLRMNQGLCLGEGVLSGPGMEGEKGGGEMLDSLRHYPPFPILLETLQEQRAIGRIREIFAELRSRKYNSPDILLHLYHMITSAITEDSIQRGIAESAWCQGLEEFFLNFSSVRSVEALEEKCIQAVRQYLDYIQGAENHLAGNLIQNVKMYIRENLQGTLAVSEIAGQFGYNASYLTRVFKQKTGYSLNDYIIQARMKKAKELLKIPGMRVGDISLMVGYENTSHFSRLFKKLNGVSPKQYQSM